MSTELYCLACRKKQPCENVKKEQISFKSKKEGKDMKRTALCGTCAGKRHDGSTCGKRVRCFVKSGESGPAPETATE